MIVITFVGYTDHLDELDVDYIIADATFNTLTQEQKEKYKDKLVFHATNESDLRLRINLQLRKALELAKELYWKTGEKHFAIIDSDLIVPNLRKIRPDYQIISPCYYAYHKGKGYIAPWCFGTNFIFDASMLNYLEFAVLSYRDNKEPVDGWIHFHAPIRHVIIPGTVHYIKTENGEVKKEITEEDWLETIRHNPIPVEVMKI